MTGSPAPTPTPCPGAPLLVEACVDSVSSACQAGVEGAGRLELCRNLVEGGTTPGAGMVAEVRELVGLPLHLMIRPRAGNFLYDADELGLMLRDIRDAQRLGANGVVLGVLARDGQIEFEALHRLVDAARPLSVTFHRAFDAARDPGEALDVLVELGVDRVLTSGQAPTAEAGIPVLAELVTESAGRVIVMAGGGIRASNARRIVEESGVPEIHLRHGAWFAAVVQAVRGET